MKKLTLLSLATALFVSFAVAVSAQEDGYVSIFNGKDLSGWSGDAKLWTVENGCIVGQTNNTDKKITVNQALYYAADQEIGDFSIKFDYKVSNWGNSGLYYRGWFLEGPEKYRMGGYQADIDGDGTYSGIMYGEAFRGILANLGTVSRVNSKGEIQEVQRFATAEEIRSNINVEGWNHYEVVAMGFVFVHKINGKVTSVFVDEDQDDTRRKSGVLGWQLHVGEPGMRVEIKNIYLKKL